MASTTYVIFDGDEDNWAYRFMRGWQANRYVDFEFEDAHDLDNMTSRAQDEQYVKSRLRDRMRQADVVVVLVGAKTKNLYRFVRWEIELALDFGLPIIVVNLNERRGIDYDRCPPILHKACAIHVPFKAAIMKFALEQYPAAFRTFDGAEKGKGPRYFFPETYTSLGL